MNSHSAEHNLDIVMCIDGSARMSSKIDEIKKFIVNTSDCFLETLSESFCLSGSLRIKIIVFRDYGMNGIPMQETPFFKIPEQADELKAFAQSISAEGGGKASNALEAIALAIKSDWTDTQKHRHIVVVFTDTEALQLGLRNTCYDYPKGMPADIDELGKWWNGEEKTIVGNFDARCGRLVLFAPDVYPWDKISRWDRSLFCSSEKIPDISEFGTSALVDFTA